MATVVSCSCRAYIYAHRVKKVNGNRFPSSIGDSHSVLCRGAKI